MTDWRIESLLSARLFLVPQLVGDRLFFISDLSGRMSLYSMYKEGSVPLPLLPPDIALQNPALLHGAESFHVMPGIGKILVMIDKDGDENYQPFVVPMDGGIPEPAFGDRFEGQQVMTVRTQGHQAWFEVDPRTNPVYQSLRADFKTGVIDKLGESKYGRSAQGVSDDGARAVLMDHYTLGDHVLYLDGKVLYGVPLEERKGDVPLNSIQDCHFTKKGLLFTSSIFEDTYGPTWFALEKPEPKPVALEGRVHDGSGELTKLKHLHGDSYLVVFNIDGCSWAYEGEFDEAALRMKLGRVLVGRGELENGVLESIRWEKESGTYALSFSTATDPSQIYLIGTGTRRITSERMLGVPPEVLSPGEDASYDSHDGLRISARLYLPSETLGYRGKRPVVFYLHGGPQSQERPDFTWFSMPLIQFLTLNGIAVFVPNARGSTGYGLEYTKRVDRDWGGLDRLDHIHAFGHLEKDDRLDPSRAGVVGRSYGGYMTLTLAGRHPDRWAAACDMFGPYNLFTFLERLPETWQTYFHLALGHPEKDKKFLTERSPDTHLENLACPMMVIQGKNDPRVVEAESSDLVDQLRKKGKKIEYLLFEDEGHDVIKYPNKVRCYSEITRFFREHLKP